MEDLYMVKANLTWRPDQLRIDHGHLTLHFNSETGLSTTFEIKVPSS